MVEDGGGGEAASGGQIALRFNAVGRPIRIRSAWHSALSMRRRSCTSTARPRCSRTLTHLSTLPVSSSSSSLRSKLEGLPSFASQLPYAPAPHCVELGSMSKLTSSAKRIQKELAEISLDPPCNCSAGPKGDNIYEWVSTIMGPAGAPLPGYSLLAAACPPRLTPVASHRQAAVGCCVALRPVPPTERAAALNAHSPPTSVQTPQTSSDSLRACLDIHPLRCLPCLQTLPTRAASTFWTSTSRPTTPSSRPRSPSAPASITATSTGAAGGGGGRWCGGAGRDVAAVVVGCVGCRLRRVGGDPIGGVPGWRHRAHPCDPCRRL